MDHNRSSCLCFITIGKSVYTYGVNMEIRDNFQEYISVKLAEEKHRHMLDLVYPGSEWDAFN